MCESDQPILGKYPYHKSQRENIQCINRIWKSLTQSDTPRWSASTTVKLTWTSIRVTWFCVRVWPRTRASTTLRRRAITSTESSSLSPTARSCTCSPSGPWRPLTWFWRNYYKGSILIKQWEYHMNISNLISLVLVKMNNANSLTMGWTRVLVTKILQCIRSWTISSSISWWRRIAWSFSLFNSTSTRLTTTRPSTPCTPITIRLGMSVNILRY